jgi:hypothetical protein
MAAAFSPSDAALEGFRLLRRRWRAAAGWSLFNLVALVALLVLLVVVVIGVVPFAGSREAAGVWAALLGGLILGLGSLAVEVVIWCGVLRVELAPEAPGFLHLRIGRDELRVLGAALLLTLAALVLAAAAFLLARLAALASPAAGLAVGALGLVAAYVVLLRLGLTPVIAFAERRISLPASWRRTHGQTWRLLGMAVLLACLVLLLWAVVSIAILAVSAATTGFSDFGLSGAEALAAHPGRYLFETGVQLLLAPIWIILGQAPWVAAYRALTEEPT